MPLPNKDVAGLGHHFLRDSSFQQTMTRRRGAVEHGGSRFLRPDPPPWRGAGVPARSPRRMSAPRAELPLSIHVRSDPFFFFFFHAALVAVAPLVLGPGRLPLGQGLYFSGSPVPASPPVATVGPAVPYCLPHDAPSFVYS